EEVYARNSSDSSLLRLPPELRNKIFGHVCGGMTILFQETKINVKAGPWASSPTVHGPFRALQQTCRQIYVETALLPFSKINQFWYYDRKGILHMQKRL
ncbi:hypothetical protein CC86DRAFT_269610, partial [Ophiobolus disseminans]